MSGILRVNAGGPYVLSWSGRRARYLEIAGVLIGIKGRPGSRKGKAPDIDGDVLIRVLNAARHELDRVVLRVQGGSTADGSTVVTPPEEPPTPPPQPPPAEQLDIFLINASTDARVRELQPNDVIDMALVPGINFEGDVNGDTPGTVASMRFSLNGIVIATQNAAPYSAFGDSSGDFLPWDSPSSGPHTLLVEAFDTDGATGVKLASLSRTFTVTNVTTPPPEPPPPSGTFPTSVTSVMPTQTALDFASKAPTGWQLVARDTFQRNIAQGEMFKPGGAENFPRMTIGEWRWVQTDPSFNDSSGRGNYKGQWTCWVQDGEFRQWIRNGPESAPFVHQASPINRLVSRPLLLEPGQTLSVSSPRPRRYAWRIDHLSQYPGSQAQGFKVANLMWGHATIGNVGYAEEDMPEHKFGDGLRGNAFHHNEGTVGGQSGGGLNLDTRLWHLWTIIYWADDYQGNATGYVEFWVDGLLRFTRFTNNVSERDVYYAMQHETFLDGDPIPGESGQPAITSTFPQGIVRTRLFQIWEPI